MQILHPAGFMDRDLKSALAGRRHQLLKLVMEIFTQQQARQELADMKRLFTHPVARQMLSAQPLQPVDIG